jgi:hypothetical protein
MLGCLVGVIWQFLGYINVIFNEGVGKNGSTVAVFYFKNFVYFIF